MLTILGGDEFELYTKTTAGWEFLPVGERALRFDFAIVCVLLKVKTEQQHRRTPSDQWLSGSSTARSRPTRAALPVGANTWRWHDGSNWVDGTLTVALVL